MQRLNSALVGKKIVPERVLQFGEGNFLRAFMDWMFHRMNAADLFNGSVVVVQPLEKGLVDLLNEQDGLYTLYLRGIQDGRTVAGHERISSISRGINPYRDWAGFLLTAHNPAMRFVVSNTTEAGITYVSTEKPLHSCPSSFPAKLTAWLAERYDAFKGAAEAGVVLMPCELINHNGTLLKECILKHACDWDLGAGLVSWLETHCTFLNTLVDRIVPGYPREEADTLNAELGYDDQLLCTAEIFHLFVLEGPATLQTELPFHQVGLNVVWCDDLQPYRTCKVGVLNGAHTASVLAAYLGGLNTVREMMEDEDFGRYVRTAVFAEIVPFLPLEKEKVRAFASSVMERFMNPYIRHELLSISLNSVSKWKVRVLPSLKHYVKNTGRIPPLLACSLAALIAFYKGDLREGYVVRDDEEILSFFRTVWAGATIPSVVRQVLGNSGFWGEDLLRVPGLEEQVARDLEAMVTRGARVVVRELCSSLPSEGESKGGDA